MFITLDTVLMKTTKTQPKKTILLQGTKESDSG